MDRTDTDRPATSDEVTGIAGELSAATVAKIIATGATSAEVLEAHTWLSSAFNYPHLAED